MTEYLDHNGESDDQPEESMVDRYPELDAAALIARYTNVIYDDDGSRRYPNVRLGSETMYSCITGFCELQKHRKIANPVDGLVRGINEVNKAFEDRVEINVQQFNEVLNIPCPDTDYILRTNLVRIPLKGKRPQWAARARQLGATPLPQRVTIKAHPLPEPLPTGNDLYDKQQREAWELQEKMNQSSRTTRGHREILRRTNGIMEAKGFVMQKQVAKTVEVEKRAIAAEASTHEMTKALRGILPEPPPPNPQNGQEKKRA